MLSYISKKTVMPKGYTQVYINFIPVQHIALYNIVHIAFKFNIQPLYTSKTAMPKPY